MADLRISNNRNGGRPPQKTDPTMTSELTSVLVTGATGNQGSAVIDQLLASDREFEVRGLTRDAASEAARDLADRGVDMREGDLYEPGTLPDAFEGVDAVFAVTNFWTEGYDGQVQQGRNIADAAEDAGVEFVVFAGVGNHDRETGIPHFDSANEIADYLRDQSFELTVLRPVFFMENWEVMVEDGTVALPFDEETDHVMTTYGDTARAAVTAVENPGAFAGEAYDVASDRLSLDEIADAITEVTGREHEAYHVPIDEGYEEFGEEFGRMCEWFVEEGYASFDANPARIERAFGFETTTFEAYLRENDWGELDEPSYVPGWAKAFQ